MFYKVLKEACDKKHTSPSAVCEALGMSKSNVTAWKAGRNPRLDVVLRIANHLGISPARLLPSKEELLQKEDA